MMENPMSGHRMKTIDVYEEWRQLHDGTWQEYQIRHYTDGGATRHTLNDPISEKEYFQKKLAGTIK